MKSKKVKINEFSLLHPNAAGIDVSSKDHVVAVPPDRDSCSVRTFGCFTCDLQEIARWLLACKIDTVALESTSVYWKQLFVVLQEHGLEVFLVNSKHVKNVTGKKTNEEDARWIQRLHSCGLLSNSFQPEEVIRTLRSITPHRRTHCESKSAYINRMVKALDEMNIKLSMVLSGITSVSGQQIIAAILEGERSAEVFIGHVHHKVKAQPSELLKVLEGNWRPECLFELKQSYELYNYLQSKIRECDDQIEHQLEGIAAKHKQGDVSGLREAAKKNTHGKMNSAFLRGSI